jgi:hypothetical protein
MSHLRVSGLMAILVLGGLLAPLAVWAQEPEQVFIRGAESGHSSQMAALEKEIDQAAARVRLKETLRAEQRIDTDMRGGIDDSQPVLVGVYVGPAATFAEYAIGASLRRVRVGHHINDTMKLLAVDTPNSVSVLDRGKVRRMYLNRSGTHPAPAGASPGGMGGRPPPNPGSPFSGSQ